ncbi:MAG: hypothetical protein WB987_03120 [Candidatus Acidiferrales bacterium]
MTKPTIAAFLRLLALAALFASFSSARAYGDVGVILNESLDTSVARVTGSGHTAVYFSRICPDSPVKLRLCRPGEEGSVMSNYINLGEDQRYEWNIAPLNMYVYGVQDTRYRPVFGSDKIKTLLEERYREQALSRYCTGRNCMTSDKAEWREMVGASMSRSMYIFVVETTVEQDLDIIAKFNALPNENHFNGMTKNCADFTKDVIDTYFPHSAHRDPINDFGMTSPKAVARTFSHYAQNHPESHFRVLHFSQLPGTIKRSTEARSGTEQLYHSKKLLIPMVIFADHELPVVAAAYLITGRFNPQHEFEQHPTVEPIQISDPARTPGANDNNHASTERLQAVEIQEREEVLGTPAEWKKYNKAFASLVDDAVRDEIIPNRDYVSRIFKRMDDAGKPTADPDGGIWMEISDANGTSKVGLSVNNIFAQGSDPRLAFELLLARVAYVLKSPKHSRETMLEFKEDWALLQYARMRISAARATGESPEFHGQVAPTPAGGAE